MARSDNRMKQLEAEIPFAFGRVQLVRQSWDDHIDIRGVNEQHHLELSLLPRSANARGCFPERWGPHRFEPIGEMFLLPAHEVIHAISDCQHQHSIICRFDPAAISQWFDEELQWTDGRLVAGLDINSSNIRQLLFRIGEEIRNPGFASQPITELMAAQVVIEMARFCHAIEDTRCLGGLSPWRLRLIDERLNGSNTTPTLEELANLCGLSVRHLTRAFRTSRGRSIGDYIADHRIEQAKQLLATGESIKAVAHMLGFTAPSNFAAAFRRATGETPREYRQRANRGLQVH